MKSITQLQHIVFRIRIYYNIISNYFKLYKMQIEEINNIKKSPILNNN